MGEATLAAFVALVLSAMLVMGLRRPAKSLGLVDRPGGRKRHHGEVPIVGGIAVFTAFIVATSIGAWPAVPFLAGGLVIVAVGIVDDLRGMASWVKLAFQALAAAVVVIWAGLEVSELGTYPVVGTLSLGSWAAVLSMIAVVGLINGVNMLDGVDGLAGGVSLAALAWLVVVAAITDSAVTPAVITPIVGALVGFLIFNMRNPWRRKASVFLGDAGSMFLGFATAWFALALVGSQDRVSPVGIAWVVALPVIDTLSLMTRRLIKGNNPFAPDREHLHHIFQRADYAPRETAALLTGLSAVMGLVGVGGSLAGVPDLILLAGLVVVALAHFVFIKTAWRTMKALRRLSRRPSRLLGAAPGLGDVAPPLPRWRARLALAGLFIAVLTAPFQSLGVVLGFGLVVVATLLVWPYFWQDVRSLPVAWAAAVLAGYLAIRGGIGAAEGAAAGALYWGDFFRIGGLISLPLAWWLAYYRRYWRALLAGLLIAGTASMAVSVDWQAVNRGAVQAPFAAGDIVTSGLINTAVLLFLVAGMVASVRRLGSGWRPACQCAVCLVVSVPLVFLLIASGYATAWVGLVAGMVVLAFLAVWYGITRQQWVGLCSSTLLIAVLGAGFWGIIAGTGSSQDALVRPLQAGMLVLKGEPDRARAQHEATVERLDRWGAALGQLADRPLVGSGVPALSGRGERAPGARGLSNLYLAGGVGFGLLGLGLFGVLGVMLARECVCAVRERLWPGESGMALLAVAVAFAVMFFFAAPIGRLLPQAVVVMLIGLLMAAAFERRWARAASRDALTPLTPVRAPRFRRASAAVAPDRRQSA